MQRVSNEGISEFYTGGLAKYLYKWEKLISDTQVLQNVREYLIDFEVPVQNFSPQDISFSMKEIDDIW